MNILPKKRWHVRTKDNVARVRRDQAQAKEEETRRLQRAALAEQESRTGFLRQRAAVQRDKDGNTLIAASSSAEEPVHQGHVNFFADLEEQERTFGVNKDYEKEKRLEKEAEERKIGLLKYLGEGSSEYMKETPWYQKAPKRDAMVTKSTTSTAVRASAPVETKHPPVKAVTSESKSGKRKSSRERKKKKRRRRSRSSSSSRSSASERASHADRKTSETGASIDIEKLRNERLRREREERLKQEALLRRMRGEKESTASVSSEQPKQIQQRYSSQFNPDLARQNRSE